MKVKGSSEVSFVPRHENASVQFVELPDGVSEETLAIHICTTAIRQMEGTDEQRKAVAQYIAALFGAPNELRRNDND